MNFLEAIATIKNGNVLNEMWDDIWIMQDKVGICKVDGTPVMLGSNNYLAGWDTYDTEPFVKPDKLGEVGEMYWSHYPSVSKCASHYKVTKDQMAATLMRYTMLCRKAYYDGFRVIEKHVVTGHVNVISDIKTDRELAIFIRDKYAADYPGRFFRHFEWLLDRASYTRDQDGKPDCVNQDDAWVDINNPTHGKHMPFHQYDWMQTEAPI
jgi:hypothetical protein